jgi:hypothetical protein
MTCPALETIAAWALGDLPALEEERLEEHLFACDACARRAQGLQRMIEQLRAALPPLLTVERRQQLSARHPDLPAVHVHAGEHAHIRLGGGNDVGIWVMHGALDDATQVDVEVRAPDGSVLIAFADVPFDARRGEVVLACQSHYRLLPMPTTMHVHVTASGAAGQRPVGTYILMHAFESL